ncbi:uncharacterized protein K441DRAFT_645948 [Cenococcum geophilum 1.58]|uniref:uncharacterized protein n=1 Tax=Cenococcum geophilum 1.58 TaxID=794803 RepID=UPI00358EFF13|nr:hypothetical protein K441DRAFT_645948 [Cenococcum geophilum 1.58]
MATATKTTATTAIVLQHIGKALGAEVGEDTIQTEVDYLFKDPKHEYEKPYDLKYDAGGIIPRTNMATEPRSILIHNFRPLQHSQSFEEYGFTSAKIDCALTASEFRNDKTVKEVYYPAIENLLWQAFPDAAEMQIIEHALRKRHPQFPIVGEDSLKFYQPARVVHIDWSPESTTRTARAAFKKEPNQYRRVLTVNFWKSFQGPGNDWPLALCDWRTVDCKSELIAADAVYRDRYTENQRLYYGLKHKWYYIKDLGDDEVIMIRQTDSNLNDFEGGGVAHTSFYNPKANENAPLRESIELRAFVFFT